MVYFVWEETYYVYEPKKKVTMATAANGRFFLWHELIISSCNQILDTKNKSTTADDLGSKTIISV